MTTTNWMTMSKNGTINTLIDILGLPDTFLKNLFEQLDNTGIDVSTLHMDHICYRTSSFADYELIHHRLLEHGALLSDKVIAGRPISVIEMGEVYFYDTRPIDIIELPSPKTNSPYLKGYEHIEFVIDGDLEAFMKKHPRINFDLKGLNKMINRDIRLRLNGGAVKFHEHSLKYVINELDD